MSRHLESNTLKSLPNRYRSRVFPQVTASTKKQSRLLPGFDITVFAVLPATVGAVTKLVAVMPECHFALAFRTPPAFGHPAHGLAGFNISVVVLAIGHVGKSRLGALA